MRDIVRLPRLAISRVVVVQAPVSAPANTTAVPNATGLLGGGCAKQTLSSVSCFEGRPLPGGIPAAAAPTLPGAIWPIPVHPMQPALQSLGAAQPLQLRPSQQLQQRAQSRQCQSKTKVHMDPPRRHPLKLRIVTLSSQTQTHGQLQ